jgi:WhiB family redox-sensing transcriptional regulator
MTPTVDLLAAIVARLPRLDGAACIGKHDVFDLRDLTDPTHASVEAEALALCRACPALAGCAVWFSGLRPSQKPHGVVAGVVHRPGNKRRSEGDSAA